MKIWGGKDPERRRGTRRVSWKDTVGIRWERKSKKCSFSKSRWDGLRGGSRGEGREAEWGMGWKEGEVKLLLFIKVLQRWAGKEYSRPKAIFLSPLMEVL